MSFAIYYYYQTQFIVYQVNSYSIPTSAFAQFTTKRANSQHLDAATTDFRQRSTEARHLFTQ